MFTLAMLSMLPIGEICIASSLGDGVELAEQEQSLAEQARAKQGELTAAERAVQALLPRGMVLRDYLNIPADSAIDAKIEAQRQLINALRQAEAIRAATSGGDLAAAESQLVRLETTKRRQDAATVTACALYLQLDAEKRDLERRTVKHQGGRSALLQNERLEIFTPHAGN
jgi:hypothetical protein